MKRITLKYAGASVMLCTLVALVALAQSPATAPEPAWYWTDVFGQRVQILGVMLADGRISWHPETATQIAPAEAARRMAMAGTRPSGPSPTTPPPSSTPAPTPTPATRSPGGAPNYGLLVEALARDSREIRASDPETLRLVQEAVGERCPREPDDEPERKPGPFQRVEWEAERLLLYGVCGCIVIAAFVVVARSKSQA
jgi:hypothetical protein